MRGIKTRRARKKELLKQKIIGFGFVLLAVLIGAAEFMLWYLFFLPVWLFALCELGCIALFVFGCIVVDEVENEEADRFWERFDV